jgi:thioredoxin-like negative regulator of GroEL
MNEIDNLYNAKQLIKNHKYVIIIWHDPGCPVCEHYLDTIKDMPNEFPQCVFALLNGDDYTDDKVFEPDGAPVTFFFKNGKRLMAPHGQAPVEIIRDNIQSIIDGTFKTMREHEQDQLDNLEDLYTPQT